MGCRVHTHNPMDFYVKYVKNEGEDKGEDMKEGEKVMEENKNSHWSQEKV